MAAIKKLLVFVLISLTTLYLVLLLPDTEEPAPVAEAGSPFIWNRDSSWLALEVSFQMAKEIAPASLDTAIATHKTISEALLQQLHTTPTTADATIWSDIEANFFAVAPLVAAQPKALPWLIDYYNRCRASLKIHSHAWDMQSEDSRNTLYKVLYGMRAAVEEVLLVSDPQHFPEVLQVQAETSATPSATILGIKVHSGDLLVSRGGAEVSALISRGNDYPGNFSHVALIYIEAVSNTPYLIEAHIEKGVAIASVHEYLADKKLRFMVLRPRAHLPQLQADPLLPHRAAESAYKTAQARHIPYDFKMNFKDSSAMFCSEVGSFAYAKQGIKLWQAASTISSPGIRNWLHTFGVENFVTQMPSDLEYDPQLAVVAEWHNATTLLKDHIDNAVIDVLLQRANAGEQIDYNPWMLPIARVLKGYCLFLNSMGKEGLIPEGMSATQALKNTTFVDMHQRLKQHTLIAADNFQKERGYLPPYWQLVKLAEQEQQILLQAAAY